jgi:hypothetical protein
MERIAMSQEERDWLKRAKRLAETSQRGKHDAAGSGAKNGRHRSLGAEAGAAHGKAGDTVVVHGLRGRPSNRKLPKKTQEQIRFEPPWSERCNVGSD